MHSSAQYTLGDPFCPILIRTRLNKNLIVDDVDFSVPEKRTFCQLIVDHHEV